MLKLERRDIKFKQGIPPSLKLLLIFAVFLSIFGRSCIRDREKSNITFENIVIAEITPVSVEVMFDINNNTFQSGKKPIMIRVYTSQNQLITDRLTHFEISAKTRSRHVQTLDKFQRPLREGETIERVEINLYQRSMFR